MEDIEQKQLLLGLLGSVYGQTQQIDQFIVGESPQLKRGTSQQIKQQFEQVLRQPIQPKQDEVVFQPQTNSIVVPNIVPDQVIPTYQSPTVVPQPPSYAVPAPFQQDKLLEVLEKINVALENINMTLEKLENPFIIKGDDQKASDQEPS